MADDRYERGLKVRREVLGDGYVDRALSTAPAVTAEFQELLTKYAWGEIWARPGLDRKIRSAITVAMLVSVGQERELAAHLRGAIVNGLTREELKEVLLQTAIYCGVPAASAAFRVAAEVLM